MGEADSQRWANASRGRRAVLDVWTLDTDAASPLGSRGARPRLAADEAVQRRAGRGGAISRAAASVLARFQRGLWQWSADSEVRVEDVGLWLFTRPGSRAGTRGAPVAARRGEPAGPARGRPILQAACAQGEAASRTLAGRQASARGGGYGGSGAARQTNVGKASLFFPHCTNQEFIQELRF